MSLCPLCQTPLTPHDTFCPIHAAQFCRAVEHDFWPGVQAILSRVEIVANIANPEPFAAAWHAFFIEMPQQQDAAWDTYLAERQQPIQDALQAFHIELEVTQWRVFQKGVARYVALANEGSPALEFIFLLLSFAIPKRRLYRRYLLRQFGFDVRRGVQHRPRRRPCPGLGVEHVRDAIQKHRAFDNMFIAALVAVNKAHLERRSFYGACIAAVAAMRQWMFESTVESIARGLASDVAPWHDEAIIQIAGWVRSQIRLYPSHHQVLREHGNPHAVLLELLPEYISSAYSEKGGAPKELLQAVRSLVGRLRQRSNRERPIRQARQHGTPVPNRQRLAESLEEWQTQEELRLSLSQRMRDAKLSPKEMLVLERKRGGWTLKDIAEDLGVTPGTVAQHYDRAKEKLKKAQ